MRTIQLLASECSIREYYTNEHSIKEYQSIIWCAYPLHVFHVVKNVNRKNIIGRAYYIPA